MLAPTVWATSWNTDLSKLSQPEGNLQERDKQVLSGKQLLSWHGHALEVWLCAYSTL